MPATYDHHVHADHQYVCTHDHDQHPRHHHDHNGSVYYYPFPGVVDVHNASDLRAWERDPDHDPADLIGAAGYDITLRTR